MIRQQSIPSKEISMNSDATRARAKDVFSKSPGRQGVRPRIRAGDPADSADDAGREPLHLHLIGPDIDARRRGVMAEVADPIERAHALRPACWRGSSAGRGSDWSIPPNDRQKKAPARSQPGLSPLLRRKKDICIFGPDQSPAGLQPRGLGEAAEYSDTANDARDELV